MAKKFLTFFIALLLGVVLVYADLALKYEALRNHEEYVNGVLQRPFSSKDVRLLSDIINVDNDFGFVFQPLNLFGCHQFVVTYLIKLRIEQELPSRPSGIMI